MALRFNLKPRALLSIPPLCTHARLLQSCLTLCDPMDVSLLGSSVHGILQARILEWAAISFFRGFYHQCTYTLDLKPGSVLTYPQSILLWSWSRVSTEVSTNFLCLVLNLSLWNNSDITAWALHWCPSGLNSNLIYYQLSPPRNTLCLNQIFHHHRPFGLTSKLGIMVDRIMVSQRCPCPNPWLCFLTWVELVVKNLPANAGDIGDVGSIPESERSPGGGNGNPLQYSCLENTMDREAWRAPVHRVGHDWSDWTRMQMWLRILRWEDYCGLSRWVTRPLITEREEWQSQKKRWDDRNRRSQSKKDLKMLYCWLWRWEKGSWAKEDGKSKKMDSP